MFRILGSRKRLCDGVTRRDWIIASAAGLAGVAPAAPSAPRAGFGKAKNVILLYPFGGPSHLETFDLKPDAPAEVRGDFKPIRSRVPGTHVCEHLPRTAQLMDKVTLLRSLTHPWNFHGMQWATTGLPKGSVPLEETQRHPEHWPFLGSVFARLMRPRGAVPDNVILPWLLSKKRTKIPYARPHASHLGNAFDPIWGSFAGEATRSVVRRTDGPAATFRDPHLGIEPAGRFTLGEADGPRLTLDRMDGRRSLLAQFDAARRGLDATPAGRHLDAIRARAFGLLASPKVRTALDLGREPGKLRESYGMTLFGQGCLQARRLVEAGCRFVTVVWDEFGQLNSGWDTHVDARSRLKNELLPGFDQAFAGLLHDLEARGLLDETLVLVLSEMGRTPKLQGDGRGHWGRAYSNLMAGAGVAQGRVIGKTDGIGAEVTDRPVTAKDVLATVYHLCGIDPHAMLPDRLGRPVPLLPYGDVIAEALA